MIMPIRKGFSSVAHIIALPTALAALPIYGAQSIESAQPRPIVTIGVTRMSSFVSLLTALPNSAATIVISRTARGPPAPPSLSAA